MADSKQSSIVLQQIYDSLFSAYGPQHWWPGETRFEIIVGALLTQNTAWTNVEKAIDNLRSEGVLSLSGVSSLEAEELAGHIRPAGYFNLKARRLLNLCEFLRQQGGEDALESVATESLREALLAVNGVGPETADDILLYAYSRPVFVVDTYTKRLFSRLGVVDEEIGYEPLRSYFETALGSNVVQYNEYHALIVRHAKEYCRKKPLCDGCILRISCRFGKLG